MNNPRDRKSPFVRAWLRAHLGRQILVRLLDGAEYAGRLVRYDPETVQLSTDGDSATVLIYRRSIAVARDAETAAAVAQSAPSIKPAISAQAEALQPGPWALLRHYSASRPRRFDAVLLFAITFAVYWWSNRGLGTAFNQDVLLADAMLHGRLDLVHPGPWLELAPWQGRFYVIDPPMPAVLLLPFVALFGPAFSQPLLSILAGAVDVALAYLVLFRLFQRRSIAIWVSVLYAFGTVQWYHASAGSTWYIAHPVALLFLWLALLELFTRGRLFLVGLGIGCAFLARAPTIFAAIFVVIYCWRALWPSRLAWSAGDALMIVRPLLLFGAGLTIPVAFAGLYNYARFGNPLQEAYGLDPAFKLSLFWLRYGPVSVRYVPIHLEEMFTSMPLFRSSWPYMVPRLYAMAIWFTTPAFVLALFAPLRQRLTIACLAAIAAIAVPILVYSASGFSQFGYRHTLDFTPFLLILVASAIGARLNWGDRALIAWSLAINLWGVIMLNFLNISVL